MIAPEELADYFQKVTQKIREKQQRGSIGREDVAELFDDLAVFIASLNQECISLQQQVDELKGGVLELWTDVDNWDDTITWKEN